LKLAPVVLTESLKRGAVNKGEGSLALKPEIDSVGEDKSCKSLPPFGKQEARARHRFGRQRGEKKVKGDGIEGTSRGEFRHPLLKDRQTKKKNLKMRVGGPDLKGKNKKTKSFSYKESSTINLRTAEVEFQGATRKEGLSKAFLRTRLKKNQPTPPPPRMGRGGKDEHLQQKKGGREKDTV